MCHLRWNAVQSGTTFRNSPLLPSSGRRVGQPQPLPRFLAAFTYMCTIVLPYFYTLKTYEKDPSKTLVPFHTIKLHQEDCKLFTPYITQLFICNIFFDFAGMKLYTQKIRLEHFFHHVCSTQPKGMPVDEGTVSSQPSHNNTLFTFKNSSGLKHCR
jgi:hypothetical protein